MLKIRLQRAGKRGQAHFKVIVTEHSKKPKGKYLELLGSYDPHKDNISVDAERVKYWISQGAKMSETLNNLLVSRAVIEGDKVPAWKPKKRAVVTSDAKQASVPSQQAETKEEKEEPKVEELKEEKAEEPASEAPIEAKTEPVAEVEEKAKEEPKVEEPSSVSAPTEGPTA